MKLRQPLRRIGTGALQDFLRKLNAAAAAGENGKLIFHASQIEPADDALSALSHQKLTRSGLHLLADQAPLALREAEALLVLDRLGDRTGKEDLRRRLFDYRAAYRTL